MNKHRTKKNKKKKTNLILSSKIKVSPKNNTTYPAVAVSNKYFSFTHTRRPGTQDAAVFAVLTLPIRTDIKVDPERFDIASVAHSNLDGTRSIVYVRDTLRSDDPDS